MNKLENGKVQIAVLRAERSFGPVQTYASLGEARKVLLALGVNEDTVASQMRLLSEIGPKELLKFSLLDVPDATLGVAGFHP